MILDKEVTDRGEINFTGGADVTPIVDVLYGSLTSLQDFSEAV